MKYFKLLSVYFILIIFSKLVIAEPLYIGSFNVNSGRTSPTTIAKQMAEHKNIDIWGLSESAIEWPSKVTSILDNDNTNYEVIKGTTGMNRNRLQIYYNSNKFHLISHTEIDEINRNSNDSKKFWAAMKAIIPSKKGKSKVLNLIDENKKEVRKEKVSEYINEFFFFCLRTS